MGRECICRCKKWVIDELEIYSQSIQIKKYSYILIKTISRGKRCWREILAPYPCKCGVACLCRLSW